MIARVHEGRYAAVRWTTPGRTPHGWRKGVTRTVARARVETPDGSTYVVKAIRVLWPRDAPVTGAASDLAGGLLPDPAATLVSTGGPLGFGFRWGVRVLRLGSRLRPAQLVWGEEVQTVADCIARAEEITRRLAGRPAPRSKRRA